MLSESSYLFGIYTYLIAGCFLAGFLAYLVRSWLPASLRLPFFLLLLALCLTPAYPSDRVETMAPALIVAGFRILLYGVDSAIHAIRPLVFTVFLSFGVSAFYLLFRSRRSSKTSR